MKSKIQWTFPAALAAVLLLSVSAHADVFVATLNGPSESPPNTSPGTGFATFNFDLATHTLIINATFTDLKGTTTNAHIHSATAVAGTGAAGVATQTPSFVGFPLGVTSGTFTNTYDTSQASFYNPVYITANGGTAASAEAALFAGITAGKAYFNIHTTAFPGGEIRGFLQAVPEAFSTLWGALPIAVMLGFAGLSKRQA